MLYKNILIPSDGKKTSEEIIEFICSIQKTINAVINVIYVIEVPRNLPLNADMPDRVEAARNAVRRAGEIAEAYGTSVNTSIIYARTAEDSIIATAVDLKCDVIAIAQDNHKLSIFSDAAQNIYKRARCSVWLFNNRGAS